MSKIPCNVNKDLLPLYVDEVCSGESRDLIEEHLAECAQCRDYYEALKEGIPEGRIKQDEEGAFSEEKIRQAAVSVIKEIKKQISMRQTGMLVAVLAAVFIFVFLLEGLNGSFMGTELGKFPLFDTRIKAEDVRITELYQLNNGYLYITAEVEKPCSISYTGNLEKAVENNQVTGEYKGWFGFRKEFFGRGNSIKRCSFIYPLSGNVIEDGVTVECENSAVYLEGKGDERITVWEKGQDVEAAPAEIEGKAKRQMEAENAVREELKRNSTDAYTIMENEDVF